MVGAFTRGISRRHAPQSANGRCHSTIWEKFTCGASAIFFDGCAASCPRRRATHNACRSASMNRKVVDVDGHVLEPADLWEKNLDPRYRDRALRNKRDESGAKVLEIAGRKSRIVQGGSLGTFGTLDEDVRKRWKSEKVVT